MGHFLASDHLAKIENLVNNFTGREITPLDIWQVPHQPEYYEQILWYVLKGTQIEKIGRLGACSVLFLVHNGYVRGLYVDYKCVHSYLSTFPVLVGSKKSSYEQ